jgi:hypothetical protein
MADQETSRRGFLAAAATAIAAPSLIPAEAEAQDLSPRQLRNYGVGFRSMGRLWHSGILPARNVRDLRFQIGMGNFQHFLADHTFRRSHDRQLDIIVNEIRNNRQLQTQVRRIDFDDIPQTFVSAGWEDRDRDNRYHFSEFVNPNESTYDSSDREIQFGMYLPIPGIRGRSYQIQLLDSKGKELKPRVGRIGKDFVTEHESIDPREWIDEFGQGKYTARFCLDGKLWDERAFCLEDKRKRGKNNDLAWNQFNNKYPATFVSTGWEDLNEDKTIKLSEHNNPNRKTYTTNDTIYGVCHAKQNESFEVEAGIIGRGFKVIEGWSDTLDANGVAQMRFKPLPAGDYLFSVTYDGKDNHFYQPFKVTEAK